MSGIPNYGWVNNSTNKDTFNVALPLPFNVSVTGGTGTNDALVVTDKGIGGATLGINSSTVTSG